MEINSLSNAKVKQWAKYKEKKYREQDKQFLIEGEHLIEEAHQAGLISCILCLQGRISIYNQYETYEVTPEILKKLSDSVSGAWIMALCHYPQHTLDALGKRVILLDDVQDPGNAGTIIRTALSFGFDSVVLSNNSVDIYNEKVIRSTQGAIFHIPVLRNDLSNVIDDLRKQHIAVYATALHNALPLSQVESIQNVALIFGNEGRGVHEDILAITDKNLYIEMETFESLNVAVAAGICMYYFKK